MAVREIKAKGPMVFITSDENPRGAYLTRQEAMLRAHSIGSLSEFQKPGERRVEDMRDQLIRAVRQAYKNETGKEYESKALRVMALEDAYRLHKGDTTW